jgi:hypothetical protein
MADSVEEVGEARTIIEQRDSYGSHSGGGYDHCPEGIPVELALLSILGICLLAVVVFVSLLGFHIEHRIYSYCTKQHET